MAGVVFRYAEVTCTVHCGVGMEGADRSSTPTTQEPQDTVRGSQRVSVDDREGASELPLAVVIDVAL